MLRVTAGASPRRPWRKRARKGTRTALFYIGLAAILLPFIFVFFWMAAASVKTQADIFASPPAWIFTPTLKNYALVFEEQPFLRYTLNSAIIATASTAIGMLLGLPAAYTIARYQQRKIAFAILAARIMPGVAYLLPLFLLFRSLKLLGSHTGLVLSHVLVTFPLTVWVMINFFEDIPQELMEAALIDGSSRIGAFLRVALPLSRPGIIATGILAFVFSWNDYKFALVLSNQATRTLPVAITSWASFASVDWGAMMASATMVTLPVLMLTLFVQRYIVTGLTMGGLKG